MTYFETGVKKEHNENCDSQMFGAKSNAPSHPRITELLRAERLLNNPLKDEQNLVICPICGQLYSLIKYYEQFCKSKHRIEIYIKLQSFTEGLAEGEKQGEIKAIDEFENKIIEAEEVNDEAIRSGEVQRLIRELKSYLEAKKENLQSPTSGETLNTSPIVPREDKKPLEVGCDGDLSSGDITFLGGYSEPVEQEEEQ